MHFLFLNTKGNEADMRKIFKYYFEDESLQLSFFNITQDIKKELILNPYIYDVIFCEIESTPIYANESLLLCKYMWFKNNKLIFIFMLKGDNVNISVYTVPHIYVIKKPLNQNNFAEAMERLSFYKRHIVMPVDNNISIRWKSKTYMLDENSIIHIRRIKHGVEIISTNGLFRHSEKLERFMEKLNAEAFCRYAYSGIVNVRFIKKLERTSIEMSNGDLINIPKRFQHDVREFIYESLSIKIDR